VPAEAAGQPPALNWPTQVRFDEDRLPILPTVRRTHQLSAGAKIERALVEAGRHSGHTLKHTFVGNVVLGRVDAHETQGLALPVALARAVADVEAAVAQTLAASEPGETVATTQPPAAEAVIEAPAAPPVQEPGQQELQAAAEPTVPLSAQPSAQIAQRLNGYLYQVKRSCASIEQRVHAYVTEVKGAWDELLVLEEAAQPLRAELYRLAEIVAHRVMLRQAAGVE
jgi:hypothetical protein